MPVDASRWLLAGVIMVLALSALVAYTVMVFQSPHHRLPRAAVALGLLAGTAPALLYTVVRALGTTL
jgi:flagellar basal body-associated protein FliL